MLFVLFLLYKQHIVHLSNNFCLMEVSILAAIIAFFLFFGRHGNVLRLHTRGKGTSRQNDEKNRKGIQQEQIVLERSARLNLDPGRGDYLIRVTGLTDDHL